MSNIDVRMAIKADAPVISEFNQLMSMETENKKLSAEVVDSGVRRLMQKPEHGFYLVAENNLNEVVGTCMVTTEWTDWRDGLFWWVQHESNRLSVVRVNVNLL